MQQHQCGHACCHPGFTAACNLLACSSTNVGMPAANLVLLLHATFLHAAAPKWACLLPPYSMMSLLLQQAGSHCTCARASSCTVALPTMADLSMHSTDIQH
eukprot:1149730-Pelagomonas_calceolata.AAC.6